MTDSLPFNAAHSKVFKISYEIKLLTNLKQIFFNRILLITVGLARRTTRSDVRS